MNNNPLISVIVPCYNQAHYLDDCIESVLNQTYSEWECIIVNDGSTDNSEEIALRWCNQDHRIAYLKQNNFGVSEARNNGIRHAKGKWILPLDGDDKIGREYLFKANAILSENTQVGLIYCKAEFFGSKEGGWNLPPYNFATLLGQNLIFCSAIYSKEDWFVAGGYSSEMKDGFEDWEFWIRLLSQMNKEVICLDYLGFYYRIKDESRDKTVNSSDAKKYALEMKIYKKYEGLYLDNFGSIPQILQNIFLLKNQLEFKSRESEIYFSRLKSIETKFLYKVIKKISKLLHIDLI